MMRDASNRVLYVGKASSLRHRVRSYFQSSREMHPRTLVMVSKVADIDVIATDTEREALHLESNLIKKHRPPYNVKLRDDKRYPMLEVTLGETYPRLKLVRRPTQRKSRYFGPFTNSQALRKTMKVLQRAFRIRTCKYPLNKPLERPCLDYHIQQCTAPCVRFISEEDYRASVLDACQFLEGHTRALLGSLRRQMQSCSDAMEFEKCIRLRNIIGALEQVTERQKMVTSEDVDEDVLGFASKDYVACVVVMEVREGKLVEENHFVLDSQAGEEPATMLRTFIMQHYGEGKFIPPLVLTPFDPEDEGLLADLLSERRGVRKVGTRVLGKVELRTPQRGQLKDLTELASRNAELHLDEWMRNTHTQDQAAQAALDELQEALDLPKTPWRIECFDISNIQGKHPVSSMVVFERARAKKSDYRRFKIRSQDTPDDFRMMRETLTRRLYRAAQQTGEGAPQGDGWTLPDLLMVDGGKGQLGVAVEVLEEQGLHQLPVCGLAKEEELIFLPGRKDPVRLDDRSPALLLLRRIRDESHRFAVTFHRQLRGKTMSRSLLDQIPGVGKTRKKALLKHFGSLGALMDASLEQVMGVPGLGPSLARTIYDALHERSEPAPSV
jgi:excinuclease ABC subunit C